MSDSEKLDPRAANAIRQALMDAKASDATAERLEETYVRYLIFANAGGILACLGIADALVNGKGKGIALSAVIGPIWIFLVGLIASGLIVSLQRARAVHESETRGQDALRILRESGSIVPTVKSAFLSIERKGLPWLTHGINFLGLISQLCFVSGAIWGLARITGAH